MIVHDVTLREAEQGYGVVFTEDEMVRLGEELVRSGVPRIEMWPIVSENNARALTRISAAHPEVDTYALVRPGYEKDLDLALECGVSGVVVMTLSLNDFVAQHALRIDPEKIVDDMVEWTARAKSMGVDVVVGPGDAYRTPEGRLKRLFLESLEAGADAVSINDSLGQATPSTVAGLVRTVRSWVGDRCNVELHCHNDFGMATANTLAGMEAGADVAEVSVNGYGERAGNAALEEVVLGATALLGLDAGIQLDRLLDLSRLASDVSGIGVPVNKPVVGESLHHIWTSLHAAWRNRVVAAGRPEAWTPFAPHVIGRDGYQVDLGPMAGRNLVRMKCQELGLDVPDDALGPIRDLVKEEGRVRGGAVPLSEFRRIVDRVLAEHLG